MYFYGFTTKFFIDLYSNNYNKNLQRKRIMIDFIIALIIGSTISGMFIWWVNDEENRL